ncbi:MAG: 16S rRNA (guanine(527)-N(7))-methyltransferase RsmG [Candidatus Poribacteria bacterium]|jgi:16S rRNA (guanine527-N7)-methyltransferase|nr:16S rRNA (guanine(527)-N(7))-methyltransferase RsmG [Candidatus Poribacteria bacterium]
MDTEKFQSLINQIFTQHGFSLTNSQVSLFTIYWENLKLWNSKINLTSIRDDHEIIMKHFLDSVAVLNYFVVQENDLVVDVGSGAGFPGIPIKILRPNLDLTLVESVSKKASFLKFLKTRLELENTKIINLRAEEIVKLSQHRQNYDLVLTRYIASIEDSIDYCLPLLKPSGNWVAFKSGNVQDEICSAAKKLKSVNAKIQSIINNDTLSLNRMYVMIKQN